jgi:hypothetical protein
MIYAGSVADIAGFAMRATVVLAKHFNCPMTGCAFHLWDLDGNRAEPKIDQNADEKHGRPACEKVRQPRFVEHTDIQNAKRDKYQDHGQIAQIMEFQTESPLSESESRFSDLSSCYRIHEPFVQYVGQFAFGL